MKKKKSKVYIPASRIIMMCLAVIGVCMILLIVTTMTTPSPAQEDIKDVTSITGRFESDSEKKEESQKNESPSKKTPAKNEPVRETKTAKQNKDTNNLIKEEQAKKQTQVQTPVQKAPEIKKTELDNNKAPAPATQNTQNNKAVVLNLQEQNTKSAPKPADQNQKVVPVTSKKGYDFPQAQNKAQLVFVFDDGGQNLSHLDKFLSLPFPVTIAVLPKLAYSKESAKKIRDSGNELMLHQPMQALNASVNPGPGAITPDMNDDQIISTLFQNIYEIGPIAGFNNHEGSAITADAEKMALVLRVAAENGIFFLDSRTNVETQVPYVAHEMGYGYYERNIFLDNEKTRDNVITELKKGLGIANKNGVVIMIGHVWSADFLPELLKEIYPELVEKGYTFSVVSKSKGLKY